MVAQKLSPTPDEAEYEPDMRCILGYLNQTDSVGNVNIGNVMQINPIPIGDLLLIGKNDLQYSKDGFLDKLGLLIIAYFCISTELRLEQSLNK